MTLLSGSFSYSRHLFQRFFRSSWSLGILTRSSSAFVKVKDNNLLPFSAMPGVKGTLRNILGYAFAEGSYLDLAADRFKRFGPIYSEEVLSTQIVNIYDLDATIKVLRAEKSFQMRPGFEALEELGDEINPATGFGLSSNDYKKWYHDRSLLSPKLMRPKEVYEALPLLNDVADDFVKRIKQLLVHDEMINIFDNELPYWSVEALALCFFNQRLGFYQHPPASEAVEFVESAKEIVENLGSLFRTAPVHKYIKIPAYYALKRNFLRNIATGMDIINKKLELQQENSKQQTVFEYLCGNEKFTSKFLAMHLTNLMAGGFDTTSTTCLWLLYELARHPRAQEKLHEELLSILGSNGEVSKTNIQRLTYLKAILKESGRLNPAAAFIIARVFGKDLDVHGYNIPAGVQIFIHEHLLSVDERYYGKDAKQFMPERWLRDGSRRKNDLNVFTSLPFGYGVRFNVSRSEISRSIDLHVGKQARS